eukprot:scaffold219593_cov38-Prasinocladus_malaysianus.AAC.2
MGPLSISIDRHFEQGAEEKTVHASQPHLWDATARAGHLVLAAACWREGSGGGALCTAMTRTRRSGHGQRPPTRRPTPNGHHQHRQPLPLWLPAGETRGIVPRYRGGTPTPPRMRACPDLCEPSRCRPPQPT